MPGVQVFSRAYSQEDWVCSEGCCFSLLRRVVMCGHHPMDFIQVAGTGWAKAKVFLKHGFLMRGPGCLAVRSACGSSRGPQFRSQQPSSVAHNCLSLRLQGIQCSFLSFTSTNTLVPCAHIQRQACIHAHEYK